MSALHRSFMYVLPDHACRMLIMSAVLLMLVSASAWSEDGSPPPVLELTEGEHVIAAGKTETYGGVRLSGTAKLILDGGTLLLDVDGDETPGISLSGSSELRVLHLSGTARIEMRGRSTSLIDASDTSLISFLGDDPVTGNFTEANHAQVPHIEFGGVVHLHDRSTWVVQDANLFWRNPPDSGNDNLSVIMSEQSTIVMTNVDVPQIEGTHDIEAPSHSEPGTNTCRVTLHNVVLEVSTIWMGDLGTLKAQGLRARDIWVQGRASADVCNADLSSFGFDVADARLQVITPVGEDMQGNPGQGELTTGTTLGYRYNVAAGETSATKKRDPERPSVVASNVRMDTWYFGIKTGAAVTFQGFATDRDASLRPLFLSLYPRDENGGRTADGATLPLNWGRLPARTTVEGYDFPGMGGHIRVEDSRIETWNGYVFGDSNLMFSTDRLGEFCMYGRTQVEIADSTLEAALLCVGEATSLTLRRCKIDGTESETGAPISIVVVSETGRVRMEDTRIRKCALTADRQASVELVRCGVPSEIDVLDSARVRVGESGFYVDADGVTRVLRRVGVRGTSSLELTNSPASPNGWLPEDRLVEPGAYFHAQNGSDSHYEGDCGEAVVGLGSGSGGWMELLPLGGLRNWAQIPWVPGGETHPAAGSVDGGSARNLVVGFGRGAQAWIAIFAKRDGQWVLRSWYQLPWYAYDTAEGETFPVLGDLDGDGKDECVLGLGPASGGWMPVLTSLDSSPRIARWVQVPWGAYNAVNGETRPAIGDFDGSGRRGLLVGLGAGSQGRMWLTNDLASGLTERGWVQVPWAAYDSANGETRPAAGRPAGALRDRAIVGLGRGAAGWMWSCDPVATTGSWLQLAGPSSWNGETRPASAPGGSRAVVGLGPGGDGRMRLFDLADPTRGEDLRVAWEAYDAANGETWPALSR